MRFLTTNVCLAVCLVVLLALLGCGSSDQATTGGPEERFTHAKKLFDNGDYLEAINEFTVITLQFPGSAVAADAQFYLGESQFARGQYVLAAYEYGVVKRNYSASPRVPEAQYKLALSYYELAPKAELDQQYTHKAIDEFQTFVEYYPANPLVPDAEKKIAELTDRLAKKSYDTARQYRTLDYYRSALFYYDDVIENYHDTQYAPLAFLEKIEILIDHRRYKDARQDLNRFLARYPNSVLRSRADDLQRRLSSEPDENAPTPVQDNAAAQNSGG